MYVYNDCPLYPPRMWDVDDSGCINLNEMTNIIATMDDVEGVEQEAKVMSRVVDI